MFPFLSEEKSNARDAFFLLLSSSNFICVRADRRNGIPQLPSDIFIIIPGTTRVHCKTFERREILMLLVTTKT
jgi:hypothetical protein